MRKAFVVSLLVMVGVSGCETVTSIVAGEALRAVVRPFWKGPWDREIVTVPKRRPRLTLTGRVVELGSGQALEGLSLQVLTRDRIFPARTDASGGFRVQDLPQREDVRLTIDATTTSYVPETLPLTLPAKGPSIDVGVVRLLRGPDGNQLLAQARSWGSLGLRPAWSEGRVVIARVFEHTSAQEAGLQPGDAIAAVGDRDVTGCGSGGVSWLMGRRPGETVSIAVVRDGNRRVVTLRAQ
jgi:hypothetical protein